MARQLEVDGLVVLPTVVLVEASEHEVARAREWSAAVEYVGDCDARPLADGGPALNAVVLGDLGLFGHRAQILLMIENHRSGMVWELTRRCPAIVKGLRRAGFTGGWL